MAKDMVGNDMKAGDKLLFMNTLFTIIEIQENRIIGGKTMTGRSVSGIKIPDVIILQCDMPFDAEKPFNGVIVKMPSDQVNMEIKVKSN